MYMYLAISIAFANDFPQSHSNRDPVCFSFALELRG